MTRRNSQNLFAGETGLLSGLALIVGMGTGDLPAPGGPVCRHLGDPLLCVRLFRSEDSADHRHQCRTVPAVLTGIPSVSEKSFDFYSKEDGTENTVTRNTSFFKMRLFFSVLLFFAYLFMNQTGTSIAGVTCTKLYETIEENYDYTNLKKYVMISDVK